MQGFIGGTWRRPGGRFVCRGLRTHNGVGLEVTRRHEVAGCGGLEAEMDIFIVVLISVALLAWLGVLAGLATATWLRKSASTEWSQDLFARDQFAWPMAASLLCAPVVFPWYLLGLLPFLTSASTLLIILWTVSIFPVYIMWHWRALGRPWGSLPGWVMALEYGVLAIAAAIMALRRITRSAALQRSTN